MYDDEPVSGRPWIKKLGLGLLALGLMAAVVWALMQYLAKPAAKPRGVQQVALIKQPPAPPPPKPPEKPPEPPKVKEEVKIDQPKDEPKPDEPKPADEKPAADKPLAVDADGSAGADGFGLAANRGGRDLLTTGGGGGGAYYSGLLQRHFFEALTRNRKVLKDDFRVVVKVWVGDDGRVQKADIVNGSGNAQVDDMIQLTLLEMSPLKDIPPSSMRPIQLRLSNRA
ncbi:MAG: TonB C-terminal domain-containing protein [Cytophagales bacterium]|nr:TonB C-terminal domain-containing protein [Rhizobacter sp.]